MDKAMEWLKQISEVSGVSGFERPVRQLLIDKLSNCSEITSDKLGSVIFKKQGSQQEPRIMIASHMDE
ncbi:MAG TPA: peptidase M28, partial [Sporomusaceae bacterium]|nr:peptidase M28 [Sporomusaceae bacterium]